MFAMGVKELMRVMIMKLFEFIFYFICQLSLFIMAMSFVNNHEHFNAVVLLTLSLIYSKVSFPNRGENG